MIAIQANRRPLVSEYLVRHMRSLADTRGRRACLVASALLATGAVAGEGRPDFSGRWILETPRAPDPAIPRTVSVRQSPRAESPGGNSVRDFQEIVVVREFTTGARADAYRIGVQGGTVSGIAGGKSPTGRQTFLGVAWDGGTLVIDTGDYPGRGAPRGRWEERREVWSLDREGLLHVVVSLKSSTDHPKTTTATYRRE